MTRKVSRKDFFAIAWGASVRVDKWSKADPPRGWVFIDPFSRSMFNTAYVHWGRYEMVRLK